MEKTIDDLKEACEQNDPERAHIVFDNLILEIARQANPEKVKEIEEICSNIQFWYA